MRKITEETAVRCDCGALATHEVEDCIEIESSDWRGWREFATTATRHGCDAHAVASMTQYRDGREIPSADCKPEKVPWAERPRTLLRWARKKWQQEKKS